MFRNNGKFATLTDFNWSYGVEFCYFAAEPVPECSLHQSPIARRRVTDDEDGGERRVDRNIYGWILLGCYVGSGSISDRHGRRSGWSLSIDDAGGEAGYSGGETERADGSGLGEHGGKRSTGATPLSSRIYFSFEICMCRPIRCLPRTNPLEDVMHKLYAATIMAVTSIVAGLPALAQAATAATAPAGPAWADPANWKTVKPIETANIVYATVPHVTNPSAEASSNPGSPNGVRPPLPNTGPPGTLDMHLDVYQVPSAKPTPVVIQLHGGGWIRGDRPGGSGSFGSFFAAGMSVVAVQYRNAIDAPAPAAIEDVRCAIAWVKANAKKYNFDPDKVITWGGSAGGHLALMAAYAPASFNPKGCADQPKVVAVIDMYGASDVAESLTYRGSMDFTHQWMGLDLPLPRTPTAAVASAPAASGSASAEPANPDGMPRTKVQPPSWPAPSEAVLARARAVSPLTYIHPGLPPTFIINGDQDHTYNPTQSYKLKAALDAAHVPNVEDIVVGGGHGNFSPAENQKGTILWMQFLHDNGVF